MSLIGNLSITKSGIKRMCSTDTPWFM